MRGCLNMYIDCKSSGSTNPTRFATAAIWGVRLNALNTGSRSCMACPSLLRQRCASERSTPRSSNASFSKKQRILSPLLKKYSSAACCAVESAVKMVASCGEGTLSLASCNARSRNVRHAASSTKFGKTKYPSSLNACSC